MDGNSSEYSTTVQVVSMRQLLDWAMRLRLRWLLAALLMPCAMALMLLAVISPAGAQWVNPDTCSWSDVNCQQAKQAQEADAASDAKRRANAEAQQRALRQKLQRLPLVPKERNVLLGSWRLEDDGQRSGAAVVGSRQGTGRAQVAEAFVNELAGMLQSGKLFCLKFQGGITFAPSTFSIGGHFLQNERVEYRSDGKQVIWAIPGGSDSMAFEIAGPDRIVIGESCAFVRVGSPAANAAANATTAPGNARTGAANASVPPAAGAMPQITAASVVVDGAAFRCGDGSLLQVSLCQGNTDDATCKLTELHLPGLQMGKSVRRADIAARVKGCEAGGIRYGADDKPVFAR